MKMTNTQKNKARLTGILYLLVIILAGFSQGYVRGIIFIPDDPQQPCQTSYHLKGFSALAGK